MSVFRRAPALAAGLLVAVGIASSCSRSQHREVVSHSRLVREKGGVPQPPAIVLLEGAAPEARWLGVHGDERPSLVFQVPARFRFPAFVPREGRLTFGVVVRPVEAPVRLRARVMDEGAARVVYDETWQQQRPWQDRSVDLHRYAGRTVMVEFTLEGGPATVALGQPEVVGRAQGDSRPNVLLYVVDCLRADHVGAYGYARPTTPSIDHLAGDGALFEKAYSCAAWTKPSVGCLFTSTYPWRHGARTLDDSLASDVTTLAEAFQAGGYATHAWVANPVVDRGHFGFGRGFDRFLALAHRFAGRNVNVAGADADAAALNEALRWVEANRDRRFFFYMHSLDLHAPYEAREPFAASLVRAGTSGAERDRDLYDTELAYNDREIGRLLDGLKRLGLYDRTLVVVTADHGEEFMEHGFGQHGRSLFDGLLHVPLILKPPAGGVGGRRLAMPAINLDVASTVLDYAGLPRPPGFEGLSLRPFVEGAPPPPARALFAEQLGSRQALYAVRDGRLKYIRQMVPEPRELLFDVERDPGETTNLLESQAAPRALADALASFIQLGLDGYHLLLSAGASGPRRVRGEAEGGFKAVMRLVMRTGDVLDLAPGGGAFDYTFMPGEPARHLVLRPVKPGATVRIWIGGRRAVPPSQVVVGASGHRPSAMPFEVRAAAAAVPSYADGTQLRAQSGQAWVFYLAPRSDPANLSRDPELAARLKALGYVQ